MMSLSALQISFALFFVRKIYLMTSCVNFDREKVDQGKLGKVSRDKGLSGGAIAAIVIVIILLVLIAVDIFCCFFNQCGVAHMCAATCAGKRREKYNVDASPEEGSKLKEVDEDGKEVPEV